jgi:type IV pilus assembly protein PilW
MATRFPPKMRGFTLVELMVGVTIGLIAILVLTQIAVTFEGQKRTTVGGAESMDEGSVGVYTLSREIQGAGYGIVDKDILGCMIRIHVEKPGNPATAQDLFWALFPVRITKGAGNAPDSLSVFYSNSPMLATAVTLIQNYPGDETNFKLSNRYGFNLGDVLLLAQPNQVPAKNCSMHEVTGLPTTFGQTDEIEHQLRIYPITIGGMPQLKESRYNKAGGLGAPDYEYTAYTTKVFDLGGTPVVNTFTVQNNQLIFTNTLTGQQTALLDNVITFKAQYGLDLRAGTPPELQVTAYSDTILDANGNGTVTVIDAAGQVVQNDPDDWLRVGAVRIAIIVRNKYPEKPEGGAACSTTTVLPSWSFGALTAADLPADWQCYRYKTFETVAPLRNMLWKTKP